MIIESSSTKTWGANGECNKCGHTRVQITETTTPSYVTIYKTGFGQFSLIKTYEWCCSKCNATGPVSYID